MASQGEHRPREEVKVKEGRRTRSQRLCSRDVEGRLQDAEGRMKGSDSSEESHKGPWKLGAFEVLERSQREEEPKREVRLGAMRKPRTSKASQGESQGSRVREQATERAHYHWVYRRKRKKRRRARKAKHPSNRGVAGLSGGECHGPCVRGGGDDPRGVRGVRGKAHSTNMRMESRERFPRHGPLEMGVREVPRKDRGQWRGLEPSPESSGSRQCLRRVCGKVCGVTVAPGSRLLYTPDGVREIAGRGTVHPGSRALYTPDGGTVHSGSKLLEESREALEEPGRVEKVLEGKDLEGFKADELGYK